MWFLGGRVPLTTGVLAAAPLDICITGSRKEACRYFIEPAKTHFCDVLHTNNILFGSRNAPWP